MAENILMSDLHLRPLTPYLCKVIDILEIDFRRFLENFARTIKVCFGLASGATFFVEFCKVDVQAM